MSTLPERLQRAAETTWGSPTLRALLSEAAQSLQAQEAVKETTINHARDPHCCGCYVIRWNDGEPVAVCGECGVQVALLDRLVAPEGWELFGYVGAFSADAMKRCAKDEHNGCVEVWMRRRAKSDIPIYLAAPSPSAAQGEPK